MTRALCPEDVYPPPLLAAAAWGLPGSSRAFPHDVLGESEWAAVMAGAQKHRLVGLLRGAVENGALPVTMDQRAHAAAAHRAWQLRAIALEANLVAVMGLLATAGVETRVLKGSAVAHLDYPDPAVRSFVDLDIMVRSRDIGRTVDLLAAEGCVRTLAEPRPGFDQRFDKGMTLVSPAGFELDLHRTFVLGPWGRLVDLDDVWDQADRFLVGGRPLSALSATNRFLHACYHAALGDWPLRLGSLRDVAEMLRVVDQDATAVRARAGSWGVESIVAAAVADANRLLGLPLEGELSEWAAQHVPTARDVSWLALHTHPNKTFAAQAIATVRVLPRWNDRLAFLRALLLPDRRYVAGRHGSATARFRHGLQDIRRGRGIAR